jgi:hypothetical protein
MSAGHVGKWLIQNFTGAPSEADLQAIEKQGYEIKAITAYDSNGQPLTYTVFGRYRGGMRMPATG